MKSNNQLKGGNKKTIPWVTLSITLILFAEYFVFHAYVNAPTSETTQEIFSDFGAPYAIQIYQGQYWGLFLNRFLHTNIILLGINSALFFLFGYLIEKKIGSSKLILLLLFSTLSTSMLQLTLSNDAGIGFAPVNFFLFAYIYAKSIVTKTPLLPFKHLLAIFSFGILFYLYYLNQNMNQFGLEGMICGWVGGFILGLFSKKYKIQLLFALPSIILLSFTLIYSPWSAEWNYSQGYEYHLKNDFKNALKAYSKALAIDPNHKASQENIRIIQIDELKEKALFAHENENYIEARRYYNELLLLDPENIWAKENLNKLP